tara:strand:- start:365 stop:670 length:306 start_codon:yes stop_codon:yes gene_type:complete
LKDSSNTLHDRTKRRTGTEKGTGTEIEIETRTEKNAATATSAIPIGIHIPTIITTTITNAPTALKVVARSQNMAAAIGGHLGHKPQPLPLSARVRYLLLNH